MFGLKSPSSAAFAATSSASSASSSLVVASPSSPGGKRTSRISFSVEPSSSSAIGCSTAGQNSVIGAAPVRASQGQKALSRRSSTSGVLLQPVCKAPPRPEDLIELRDVESIVALLAQRQAVDADRRRLIALSDISAKMMLQSSMLPTALQNIHKSNEMEVLLEELQGKLLVLKKLKHLRSVAEEEHDRLLFANDALLAAAKAKDDEHNKALLQHRIAGGIDAELHHMLLQLEGRYHSLTGFGKVFRSEIERVAARSSLSVSSSPSANASPAPVSQPLGAGRDAPGPAGVGRGGKPEFPWSRYISNERDSTFKKLRAHGPLPSDDASMSPSPISPSLAKFRAVHQRLSSLQQEQRRAPGLVTRRSELAKHARDADCGVSDANRAATAASGNGDAGASTPSCTQLSNHKGDSKECHNNTDDPNEVDRRVFNMRMEGHELLRNFRQTMAEAEALGLDTNGSAKFAQELSSIMGGPSEERGDLWRFQPCRKPACEAARARLAKLEELSVQ